MGFIASERLLLRPFQKVILPIPLLFISKRKSAVSYSMSLGRQKQQLRLLPKNANSTP